MNCCFYAESKSCCENTHDVSVLTFRKMSWQMGSARDLFKLAFESVNVLSTENLVSCNLMAACADASAVCVNDSDHFPLIVRSFHSRFEFDNGLRIVQSLQRISFKIISVLSRWIGLGNIHAASLVLSPIFAPSTVAFINVGRIYLVASKSYIFSGNPDFHIFSVQLSSCCALLVSNAR